MRAQLIPSKYARVVIFTCLPSCRVVARSRTRTSAATIGTKRFVPDSIKGKTMIAAIHVRNPSRRWKKPLLAPFKSIHSYLFACQVDKDSSNELVYLAEHREQEGEREREREFPQQSIPSTYRSNRATVLPRKTRYARTYRTRAHSL